jgi:glyoxylase-like metal-dependent hydrolase (beta-lactamase superfamily II)
MKELNRRTLLAGASALTTAALIPAIPSTIARAAAPAAGKQAPGFYRYKVGDFEVTAVTDGAATFPLPDKFVNNQDKATVQKELSAAFQPTETVTVPFTPIVVNTGSKLVVIDTGYGPASLEATKGRIGQFHTNLTAAGIDRASVDTVIISHFHMDHISGLRTVDGGLAFPNAEIIVPAQEWAFWMSDAELNKQPEGYTKGEFPKIRKVLAGLENKVTKYEGEKELAPGIRSIFTPGHTPGHYSFTVASGNSAILVQVDIANIPHLFLRNPDWHVVWDVMPDVAATTRKKIYDMAAADRTMIQGFHFPFPSAGYVEKDGNRYRLIPIPWNPLI